MYRKTEALNNIIENLARWGARQETVRKIANIIMDDDEFFVPEERDKFWARFELFYRLRNAKFVQQLLFDEFVDMEDSQHG